MQPTSSREIFRFGGFELEIAARRLQRDGWKVPLEEKPFRLLAVLVSHAGETLTREELSQVLWSDDVHVSFGHGLNNAVNKVRSALGDAADNPRFIATVQRMGYRFIAPVARDCRDSQGNDLTRTSEPLHERDVTARKAKVHSPALRVGRRLGFVATVLPLLTAALLLISARYNRSITRPQPSSVEARKAGEAYALGLDSQKPANEEALWSSKQYFEQAIALDPTFAEAHAQLALIDELIGDELSPTPRKEYERAAAEARRALDLDPSLAEAHVAFGNARLRTDWDWDDAKHEYLRALDLNPRSVVALEAYARFLGATGRNSESLRVIAQAQTIDPLSVRIQYDQAHHLMSRRERACGCGDFCESLSRKCS